MNPDHEKISQRAHQIWEQAGRPDGNHDEHWLQAERELHAQSGKNGGTGGTRGPSVEPPIGGKKVQEKVPHSTDYKHPGVTTDSLHHHRNG